MAMVPIGKSEQLKPDSALVGKLRLIGMVKGKDPEDGAPTYEVVVVTLKDGKVVEVEKRETCYSDTSAINVGTGWIDGEWYDD
jgi:hypothetical protein